MDYPIAATFEFFDGILFGVIAGPLLVVVVVAVGGVLSALFGVRRVFRGK